MAIRDPRILARPSTRYELKIHEVALEDVEPLGDRYVIEVLDMDERIELGQLLVVTQQTQVRPGDPMADPTIENRGVIAGVVVRAGNGHLLGLSDLPPVFGTEMTADGGLQRFESPRPWASVPMFYKPGDVVLVDYNAKGRALKILGREGRIVNQIDCLARLPMRLKRTENGWEPE